jgi:hypothetical protein
LSLPPQPVSCVREHLHTRALTRILELLTLARTRIAPVSTHPVRARADHLCLFADCFCNNKMLISELHTRSTDVCADSRSVCLSHPCYSCTCTMSGSHCLTSTVDLRPWWFLTGCRMCTTLHPTHIHSFICVHFTHLGNRSSRSHVVSGSYCSYRRRPDTRTTDMCPCSD